MFADARQVTIEWGDCDPAGIVYYPRYFQMFDTSTAHLLEAALALNKRGMMRRYGLLGIPMVDTRAKFIIPSRFGDSVTIETRIAKLGRTSFDVSHRMLRRDGALAIEAWETRVWTVADPADPERIKSQPIPQEVIDALSRAAPPSEEPVP